MTPHEFMIMGMAATSFGAFGGLFFGLTGLIVGAVTGIITDRIIHFIDSKL